MAEETQVASGNDGSQMESGQTSEVDTQDNAAQTSAAGDGSQTSGQDSTGDEGNDQDGIVTDENGKKFWPEEAVMARINKLTSQKHNADAELLEAIKTNPDIRKKFQEALQLGEESATSSEESEGPTPFEQFLAPLPQEHQAHYRGLFGAFAKELEGYMEQQLESFKSQHVAPLMSWVGQEKVRSFAQTNKDFPRYQSQVRDILEAGRAKSVEDAFILASYGDRMKGAQAAGAKQEANRQTKISRASITSRSAGGSSTKTQPVTLREALEQANKDIGYTS